MERITIFNGVSSGSKVPYSPYGDNTFTFLTYDVSNNLDFFKIMVSKFILNIPLTKQTQAIRTFRRKSKLEQFYAENITYIILDIDNVTSTEGRDFVLNYFKDFKCILGKSRSYNEIDSYNLKGVLFTEEIPLSDAKIAVSKIHHDLKDFCKIDEAVVRRASLNAPVDKFDVLLNNETGDKFKFNYTEAKEKIKEIKKEYIGENIKFNVEELENIEATSMEKLCLKVFQSMGFEATKANNSAISFKHPTEEKSVGGYFWFSESPYTMHHPNSTKSVNIFETVRKLPQAKEFLEQEINYDDKFLQYNTDTIAMQVNDRYLEVTEEINNNIKNFLNSKDGLFSIKSPMGTGKSTIIGSIIDEAHEEDMRVLIITNRISVAVDFADKYDMKLYNKDKYTLGDSLVCQFDSLWKFDIKAFDVVIMDEFISLMLHARSNLSNSVINLAKFFASFTKKLVIADAFLTGYENFLLNHKKNNIYLVNNAYRDNTTLLEYEDLNYFVRTIIQKTDEIENTKAKITISATSLAFINQLSLMLNSRGLKVVTLTAETPETTKELIYDLFKLENHDKFDVLIFSPTLTVGVSNLNNVMHHFHYDSSMSTDVISSIQMIKRSRKSKEIHLHIKPRISYVRTSYNEIRDEYMQNIGANIQQNYLFEVNDYGEPILSKLGVRAIKIDTFRNILQFNHRGAFMYLCGYHFRNPPRIITEKFESNALTKYKRELKVDSELSQESAISEFLSLNEMERSALHVSDYNSNKFMRILIETNESVIECEPNIKEEIFKESFKDSGFIQKCRFYKGMTEFTNMDIEKTDIEHSVHRAVIDKDSESLLFYNRLLEIPQIPVFENYIIKDINKNRKLKWILTQCGYSVETSKNMRRVGHRSFHRNQKIHELYRYIK